MRNAAAAMLRLHSTHYHPLSVRAFILVIVSIQIVANEDIIKAPITTFHLPSNAQPNDELLADLPLQVDAGSEDVAISLEPPSETVVVSPTVVGPNSPIHLLVIDPQKLRNQGGEKLKLRALTLIAGKEQEVPIEIQADISESDQIVDEGAVPPFEKDDYDLLLEHNFNEREIAIVKLKSEPPPETRFSLIGPLAERFTVTKEGQLVYLTAIPCETPCTTPTNFTLLLVALNKHAQQVTTLTFKADGNEQLRFVNAPYNAVVEEETGVFVKAVKVQTLGAKGEVIYTLQDTTGLFSIHPKTGILMAQHPEFLTRAGLGSQINLTVTATDKKATATTLISVSLLAAAERLKSFNFAKDSYSFTVPAGETLIGTVKLVGAENHTIQYGIAEGGQGAVSIDDNGVLYHQREPEKESRNYTVLVSARSTDGQYFVATTWAQVAVEGLHSYPLKVNGSTERMAVMSASTTRGSKLSTITLSDADEDATVQLSITSISGIYLNGSAAEGLPPDMFRVQMTGQQAQLSLNKPIVDLPLASLTLELSAQDLAHPNEPVVKVIKHVIVVRKHRMAAEKPLPFEFIKVPKTIEISGDADVGTIVYRPMLLQSVISNSTVFTYDIDSSLDAFNIDNVTGTITTSRTFNESAETLITVTVTDPVAERSTQVNLTVSVTSPTVHSVTFMERQYSGSVKKTDAIGTTVIGVTAKTDRGEVVKSYSLEGTDAMFFTVDNQGAISLKDSIEDVPRSELNFVVRASDSKISSAVPIHITIQTSQEDTELVFEKSSYEVKVMENIPVNGYVLQPRLVDSDLSGIEYTIEALNDATIIKDLLDIDSDGRVTIKDELQGYVGRHEFQIRATQGKRRATADVKLHILEAYRCVPMFLGDENMEFTVRENSPVGAEIGTVSAAKLDSKCELKYHLWDPLTYKYTNQTDIVSIDVSTGQLQTRVQFDYEEMSMYPLVLGLQAGAHQFVQLASTLRVLDVDDHPLMAVLEKVAVEVPEDVAIGTVIATMRAADGDESQQVFYRLRNESKEFAVNATTGEVTVVYGLDRETKDFYSLEIGATNDEDVKTDAISVWMTLDVRVTDVNDNGPLFERSRYFVLAGKNTLPGEEIVTVRAYDPDLPTPGNDMKEVFYRIKESLFEYHGMTRPIEGVFAVKQTSGVVVLEQTVHDFVGGVFHLLLESMDSLAANAHKDQSIVKVYIHDESDIVRLELPIPPAAVNFEKVDAIKKTIAEATGLNVIVKDLQYHHEEGSLIYDITDLRLVLVNRTTSEIIPAERAIAIADKHRSFMGPRVPNMTKAQVISSPVMHHSIPPIAYVLSVFALSLTMIFMIFGFMMCHYRNRFKQEKKLREDDAVIANTLVRPPVRPMKISPIMPTRAFEPHFPAIDGQYAVQEVKMVVGAADDKQRRSKPW